MKFLYPEFIYLMLLPAGVLVYLISTNKDTIERMFSADVLARLRIEGDALGRKGHNTLIFTVFFFMTLALARPVIEEGETRIESRGVDLVIALDLSRSMQAADFYPNRLRFAKQKIGELLPVIRASRIGMIGFTTASFIVAPLTGDRESLLFLLRRLSPRMIESRGTDLATAIDGAGKMLQKSEHRALLLVTDGGDSRSVEALVSKAKALKMKVVVWMMASERGAPVPLRKREKGEEVVMTRANPALRKLAEATGGIFVPATFSQEDEKRIARFFERVAEGTASYETVVHHRIELFPYPLILALLILPFALYSMGKGAGKGWIPILLLFSLLHPQTSTAGLLDFLTISKGIEAYERGDYEKAIEAFEKLALPTAKEEVWLALGNSYYRSGRYKRACWAYGNVITADPYIEWEKLYNLANCHVKLGDLEKAAELYRKVLEIHEDEDARYNLSLVLEALKKRKRQGKKKSHDSGKSVRERKKGSGQGNASKGESGRAGSKSRMEKGRELSREEERRWIRMIEKQPLRTRLYPLTRGKEDSNVDPW
ncbi:VWA domain-containing protein [Hydrogenimonas sp.]